MAGKTNVRPGGRYDWNMTQGVPGVLQFTIASDALASLSGCTAAMEVQTTDGVLLSSLTSSSGITLSTLTVTATLSTSATSALPVGTHQYEIQITDSGGNVPVIVHGLVTVHEKVIG